MSTIEGGMICTDDEDIFQTLKMLRGHGLLRESNDQKLKDNTYKKFKDLNKDFIFLHNGFNLRNNEIGGLLGISQLRKLDKNIKKRQENLDLFLSLINKDDFYTDFKVEGSSNYAFNVILKKQDDIFVDKLINKLNEAGIEFRRGSAGGGNQLRQPYLQNIVPKFHFKKFINTEHIHFYGFYIGNFPSLKKSEIKYLCNILNSIR